MARSAAFLGIIGIKWTTVCCSRGPTYPIYNLILISKGQHSESVLPLVILFAAVAVFFARVLFTHHYLIPWDFRGFHLPLAMAVFDAMKGTGSVLWDTSTYCGRPLFADPQAQVFYPPTDVAVFVSTLFGPSSLAYVLEWQLALHVFAAGAFTYLLLRRLGLSSAAALCGGLVYELGGFFASQTQHLGAINSASWIPLMWAAAWELRKTFTGGWYTVLTVAGAMTVLAGFPAVAATAFVSTILYSSLLVLFREMRFRQIGFVLAAIVSSMGVSAVMLVSAVQLTSLSVGKYRTDWFDGSGFPPKYLISLISPPTNQTIGDLLYCGIGGLLMASIGVFDRPSRRTTLPVVCLTALSGVWMLETVTPFGRFVWAITPRIVRGSLYPHYGMATFCLDIAVLAAIGLDQTKRLSVRQKYAAAVLVGADLIIVGSGRPMNTVDVRREPGITREQIDGSTATVARLRQLTSGQPPAPVDTHQSSVAFSTTAPLTQIPTANGYNPLVLERLIQARLSFAKGYRWGAWYEVENLASPVIDALNIRYILTNEPLPTIVNGISRYSRTADLPGFLVYQNSTVLPRFWIVHKIRVAHTPYEAFNAIHSSEFRPSSIAVVEAPPQNSDIERFQAEGNETERSQPDEGVNVFHYGARDITLTLKSKTRGFLVTSEVQYPGWHAFVDGSEASIFMTNGAFRGVVVPAGDHIVRFRFGPDILYVGIALSATSICVVLLVSRRKTVSS